MSNQISGGQGRRLGHHLGHGFGRPIEGMCMLIPFTDELFKLRVQVIFRGKINNAQYYHSRKPPNTVSLNYLLAQSHPSQGSRE